MRVTPRFVFLSQSTSQMFFDLARRVAREMGPTLLITGNTFPLASDDRLDVWLAPAYDNSSLLSRVRTSLAFMVVVAMRTVLVKGRAVVLLNSNPPFLLWLGYMLKKLRRWPYIVRTLDVYPDAITRLDLLRQSNVLVRAWYVMNRAAYRAADVIVSLGPVMCEAVARQVRGDRAIERIPDWVDPDQIRPIPKAENPAAIEYGEVGKLTVMYSGNLGLTHDMSGLFIAIDMLRDDRDISFVFVGGGVGRQELERFCRDRPNAKLLPFQPVHRVPLTMAMADVALVALGRCSAGVSMPSKAYYSMAAGCALLGLSKERNDLRTLIESFQCGLDVESDSAAAVRDALVRFRDDSRFLQKCRENARSAAERVFSRSMVEGQYMSHLRQLAARTADPAQPTRLGPSESVR